MSIFQLIQDGQTIYQASTLSQVITQGNALLAQCSKHNQLVTFTSQHQEKVLAVHTNRRIIASVIHRRFIQGVSIPVDVEMVDVTQACLSLPLSELTGLKDVHASTASLVAGLNTRQFDDYFVIVTEGVAEFFGVNQLSEISQFAVDSLIPFFGKINAKRFEVKVQFTVGLESDSLATLHHALNQECLKLASVAQDVRISHLSPIRTSLPILIS